MAHHKAKVRSVIQKFSKRHLTAAVLTAAALGFVGSVFILASNAATSTVSMEAEVGTPGGPVQIVTTIPNSSGGSAVQFAAGGGGSDDKTPGARRPLKTPPTGCTENVSGSAAASAVEGASGGDVICITGDVGDLEISNSGSASSLIKILGDGSNTKAQSLNIEGDYVYVSGIDMIDVGGEPLQVSANNVTVEDVIVDTPKGGSNGDASRFWGSYITFRHNTYRNTNNDYGHADAAQNYSTSTSFPRTNNIVFEYNLMENIANICLIMEGPDSSYGDGDGEGDTYEIMYRGNYCDAGSAQGIWLDDVQDWTVEGSTFKGTSKGIGADNASTGGTVTDDNVFEMSCEVGLSSDSEQGYTGPPSSCDPDVARVMRIKSSPVPMTQTRR